MSSTAPRSTSAVQALYGSDGGAVMGRGAVATSTSAGAAASAELPPAAPVTLQVALETANALFAHLTEEVRIKPESASAYAQALAAHDFDVELFHEVRASPGRSFLSVARALRSRA